VIVGADGRAVERVSTLQRIVRSHEPGESVALDIMRYGKRQTIRVRLEERKEAPVAENGGVRGNAPVRGGATPTGDRLKIGFSVEPVTEEFARDADLGPGDRGLRVTDVSVTGPARGLITRGDVITDVQHPVRKKVKTVADLQSVLSTLKPGDVISLRVYGTAEPVIGARVVNLRVPE
jgi:serine protease Do